LFLNFNRVVLFFKHRTASIAREHALQAKYGSHFFQTQIAEGKTAVGYAQIKESRHGIRNIFRFLNVVLQEAQLFS